MTSLRFVFIFISLLLVWVNDFNLFIFSNFLFLFRFYPKHVTYLLPSVVPLWRHFLFEHFHLNIEIKNQPQMFIKCVYLLLQSWYQKLNTSWSCREESKLYEKKHLATIFSSTRTLNSADVTEISDFRVQTDWCGLWFHVCVKMSPGGNCNRASLLFVQMLIILIYFFLYQSKYFLTESFYIPEICDMDKSTLLQCEDRERDYFFIYFVYKDSN